MDEDTLLVDVKQSLSFPSLLPAVDRNDGRLPLLVFVTEPSVGPPQRHQTRQEAEGSGSSQESADREGRRKGRR